MYVTAYLTFMIVEKDISIDLRTRMHSTKKIYWYRIDKCTSHPELFMIIHKYIKDFHDVRTKYHLYPNDIYFYGVKISDEYVSACTEELQSRNWDDKNENCNKK